MIPVLVPTFRLSRSLDAQAMAASRSAMFTQTRSLALENGRGRLTTDLIRIGEPGFTLGRVISPGHRIDLTEDERITFLLPQAGRLDIRVRGAEFRVQAGRLTAFRPTERSTQASPDWRGRFQAATLLVPMAAMSALAARLGRASDPGFATDGVALSGPAGRYMADNLMMLVDDLLARPSETLPRRLRDEIEILIEEALAEIIGAEAVKTASRRVLPALHRVRLAEEILHAEADEPLSMLELAERLDVGLRSLQLAFQEVHGRSPREVLQEIRLDRARRRLLAARGEALVTAVAMDSGFFHLGRFAQSYARAFGERPSETLGRRGVVAMGQVRVGDHIPVSLNPER